MIKGAVSESARVLSLRPTLTLSDLNATLRVQLRVEVA